MKPSNGIARKVGDEGVIEILSAEGKIGWSPEQDAIPIMCQKSLFAARADAIDLVGRVASSVEIFLRIQSQAVGETAYIRGVNLREADRPIRPHVEAKDAIVIALHHEQLLFIRSQG